MKPNSTEYMKQILVILTFVSTLLGLSPLFAKDTISTNGGDIVVSYTVNGSPVELTFDASTKETRLSTRVAGTDQANSKKAMSLLQMEAERIILSTNAFLGSSGAHVICVDGYPLYKAVNVFESGSSQGPNKKTLPGTVYTLTFGTNTIASAAPDCKVMITTAGQKVKPRYYPYSIQVVQYVENSE